MKKIRILLTVITCLVSCNASALTYEESNNILVHLKNENFSELSVLFHKYFDLFEKDINKEEDVDQALEVLASSPEWIGEKVKLWKTQSPDSYLPYLAAGLHNYRLGWDRRGQKIIDITTKKQIDKMIYHFNVAKLNFNKALDRKQDLIHVYAYLTNISMHSRNPTETVRNYEKGLKVNPYSHRLHLFFSFALLPRWGGSLELLSNYKEFMIKLSKDNPKLMTLAGIVDKELGDQKFYSNKNIEAIKYYEKAEKYGGFWSLYSNIGDAYQNIGSYDQAIKYYKKLVKLRPMHPDAYHKLSQAYLKQENFTKSVESIGIARYLNPNKYEYITMEAQIYFDSGDYDKSMQSVNLAKKHRPDDERLDGFIETIKYNQQLNKS